MPQQKTGLAACALALAATATTALAHGPAAEPTQARSAAPPPAPPVRIAAAAPRPAEPAAFRIAGTPYQLTVTPAAVRDALEAGEPVLVRGNDIVVLGDNKRLELNCKGENLIVLGDGNRITVTGDCAPLLVSGSGNMIELEKVRYIETRGTGNAILWDRTKQDKGAAPKVSNPGGDNVVLPVLDL